MDVLSRSRAELDSREASTPLVSIVVPFYNEGVGVALFHEHLSSALDGVGHARFEVVCVDDGSDDDTLAMLIAVAERDSRFRVIELSRNFGKEAALSAGLDAAAGDAAIPMDADLQDPPAMIERLIAAWQQGADVVLAHRIERRSDTFLKRTSAQLFYRFHNKLSDTRIPENVGDFRLMNRAALDALRNLPERNRFNKGLFAWVGFRTAIVDYARNPRAAGTTKFSGWKLWNFALEGLTSFSTAPLRLWTYLGGIGAAAATVYGSFSIVRTLIHGVDVPGYASLLVIVLFVGSVQLIGIGVLGEYIGRIYVETKQRPRYIVRRVYSQSPPAVRAESAAAVPPVPEEADHPGRGSL
jgi:glycosyltransferase involved in cell wall biosynthesis